MGATYEWSVTGLVAGRTFTVTSLEVRDGVAEIRYTVRPGISPAEARQWRSLLPRLRLVTPASDASRVEGGFDPQPESTSGELACHHDDIRAGHGVTLVLESVTEPRVEVTLVVHANGRTA